MNNQGQYRVLLYLANKQPVGSARITGEFKLSVQKNNYAMFYDETKQLWSILFDTEDLIVAFTTQVDFNFRKFKYRIQIIIVFYFV